MAEKFKANINDRLTEKQLTKIIKDNKDPLRYLENESYFKGKNVAIYREWEGKEIEQQDPNTLLPLPFARKTINDLKGYAYKPGNVQYQFDEKQNNTSVEIIQEIFKENDEALTSSEIFEDTSIKGEGAEIVYFSDEKIQFAKIKREQCIFKYKDTIKEKELEYSIRYYDIINIKDNGKKEIIHKAVVYYPTRIDYFESKENIDNGFSDKVISLFNKDYSYIESEPHPFEKVPLHPYRINSDKLGIFEPSIPMIDAMDDFSSDGIVNTLKEFNDVILLLSQSIDSINADQVKDQKIFADLGTKEEGNFVEFLQRNLNLEATLESAKMIEKLYYELTQIPNFSDEKFNVKSGIAIAYSLVSFENLVTTMETYFSKGLLYRLELINNALKYLNNSYEPVTATLQWVRNLPFDIREKAEIAEILKRTGLMSDETILKLFPHFIIEDPKKEIEKARQEKKENIADLYNKQQLLTQEPKIKESNNE